MSAKRESSPVGLSLREPGTRVMMLGRRRREAHQGIRWKGSAESLGAIGEEGMEGKVRTVTSGQDVLVTFHTAVIFG